MQQTIILIVGSTSGAILTYLLQKQGLSGVVASCLIGLAGAELGFLLKLDHLAEVVFAGSFVGMTETSMGSYGMIVLGGILTGVLYRLSMNVFEGFGGRLGTIAFISTVASYLLFLGLFRRNK